MNNVITRVIHIRYFVFTIHSVGKMRVFTMCILTFFKIQLRIQEMNTNYKLAVLWVNLFSLVALFFIKWSWLVLSRNWRIFRRSNSSSSSAAFCSTFFFGGASLPVLPSKSSVVVASCLRSLLAVSRKDYVRFFAPLPRWEEKDSEATKKAEEAYWSPFYSIGGGLESSHSRVLSPLCMKIGVKDIVGNAQNVLRFHRKMKFLV